MLADPESPKPSLVRAVYQKKQIDVKGSDWGFYRFADWLPVHRLLRGFGRQLSHTEVRDWPVTWVWAIST